MKKREWRISNNRTAYSRYEQYPPNKVIEEQHTRESLMRKILLIDDAGLDCYDVWAGLWDEQEHTVTVHVLMQHAPRYADRREMIHHGDRQYLAVTFSKTGRVD